MKDNFILKDHIEKLQQFIAVGESKNISMAARQVHLTQSALSHSIRALEQALDTKLLIRKARGVDLTESGKILFNFSHKLLDELEDVELKLRHPLEKDVGRMRIGTHETLAIHIFPALVRKYFCSHRFLTASLTSGRVDSLVSGVLEGDFDVILTVEPFKDERLQIVPLYRGEIGFFVGTIPMKKFSVLKKSRLNIDEVNQVPLLTDVEAHIRQGLPIPQALASLGLSLRNLFSLNSFEASMRMAAEGAGVAVVADRNAAHLVREGKLRRVQVKGIKQKDFGSYRICITYLKSNEHRGAIQDFVRLLKSHIQ